MHFLQRAAAPLLFGLFSCGDDTSTGGGGTGGAGGGPGPGSGAASAGGSGGSGGNPDGGSGGSPSTGGAPATTTGGSGPGGGPIGGAGGGMLSGCQAVFDGVDDVLIADVGTDAVNDGQDFSLGVRVRPDALANGESYFLVGRHADGGPNGHYLKIVRENGQLLAQFLVFLSSTNTVSAPLTLSPSGEAHLLGAFDGSELRLYIDGELAATLGASGSSPIDPSSMLTVGRSFTGLFPYAGELTDVVYLPDAVDAPFDPAVLTCANGATLHYTFETIGAGVPDVCMTTTDAVIGESPGADSADPTFICAK